MNVANAAVPRPHVSKLHKLIMRTRLLIRGGKRWATDVKGREAPQNPHNNEHSHCSPEPHSSVAFGEEVKVSLSDAANLPYKPEGNGKRNVNNEWQKPTDDWDCIDTHNWLLLY